MALLYEGALLAVLVVWFFLRDWRATFVSAVALPLSAIPAFIGCTWMGFSLNVVTLLALSLVVGILVDDAIVEIENIMRHLRMGKTPYQAAMEAADEIGLAVIATTFTLIAVFLPTAFMSGMPGKFFVQFGWTAAIAVFFSLVVARMLTPMMAAYMLQAARPRTHGEPRWMPVYLRWALVPEAPGGRPAGHHRVLRRRRCADPLLPTGFIPPDDLSQTQVYLSLPPGSTFAQTLRRGRGSARGGGAPTRTSSWSTPPSAAARPGSDPFMPRRRRGAQGHADHQPDAARERPASPSRPSRPSCARRWRAARRAHKVGLGGSGEKYILVLAGDDGARAGQHMPRGRARAAHHPRHRQHHQPRQPGAARDRRAPRLCARRRPGRHRRPSPTRCASPPRATTTGAAQAQPVPAPGAHRGQAARRARRTWPARAPGRARRARARCRWATWPR
jgi:hypothetical protein